MFPDINAKHPEAAAAIETLTAQHHHIDPLLEQGDAAFAERCTRVWGAFHVGTATTPIPSGYE